jgi:hypothetical protein
MVYSIGFVVVNLTGITISIYLCISISLHTSHV